MEEIIKLINCSFEDKIKEKKIDGINVTLKRGDVFYVETDSYDKASLFLRALATLEYPLKGEYFFLNENLDFSDYRNLLLYKKKIAYIGIESSLLSRRSLKDNILISKEYETNEKNLSLNVNAEKLCEYFNLQERLNSFPKDVNMRHKKLTMLVRELTKDFEMVLLDCPETFLNIEEIKYLKDFIGKDKIVVFISYNESVKKIFNAEKLKRKN